MFSQAPIILALLWAVLLSSCTRSGSGTGYQPNNAKVLTYTEIRDALDGFGGRNIAFQPTARSRSNKAADFAASRGQGKKI